MANYGTFTGQRKIKSKINEATGNVTYRTIFTDKNQNGETIFGTMFVNFVGEAKNKPVDNDDVIDITKSFIKPRQDANGNIQWILVVQDFDYTTPSGEIFGVTDSDDDLPF